MKHLLSSDDLTRSDIERFLKLADSFAEVQSRTVPKVPVLRGKTVVLAFFEDSTRTRVSFDIAARRLSADVVNFSAAVSSTNKGESLRDTIETISAMGVDAIVLRHASSGAAQSITRWTDAAVINAGDGWHQHPTQALLDAYALGLKVGSLQGLRVAVCGDVQHSRVARSVIDILTKLGCVVTVVGPRTLMPPDLSVWPVEFQIGLESVISDVDVVYMLRVQYERLGAGQIPSSRDYRDRFGLTVERTALLPSGALIMHPGPINRGVELDPEVCDDPRTLIVNQVAAGVPVRMAVLYELLGPGQLTSDTQVADTQDGLELEDDLKERS